MKKSWHELEADTKSAWPCIAPLHRTGKCKSFLTENCSLDIQLYLCQLVLYCHLTLALLICYIGLTVKCGKPANFEFWKMLSLKLS